MCTSNYLLKIMNKLNNEEFKCDFINLYQFTCHMDSKKLFKAI